MSPAAPDRDELLIWRLLGRLEALALKKYESLVPQLATPEKKTVVERLRSNVEHATLPETPLDGSIAELLAAADRPNRDETLLVQGFVLERLGQVIYRVLEAHPGVSARTKEVASLGANACGAVIDRANDLIRHGIGAGEAVYDRFCVSTDAVLRRLDGLGTGVDEMFGQRFGLTFSELIGEFTAELLPACVSLGMNRRKLVCHLAGVFMGG
jgi:hypothetical protein